MLDGWARANVEMYRIAHVAGPRFLSPSASGVNFGGRLHVELTRSLDSGCFASVSALHPRQPAPAETCLCSFFMPSPCVLLLRTYQRNLDLESIEPSLLGSPVQPTRVANSSSAAPTPTPSHLRQAWCATARQQHMRTAARSQRHCCGCAAFRNASYCLSAPANNRHAFPQPALEAGHR